MRACFLVLVGCGRLGFETSEVRPLDAAPDASSCAIALDNQIGHWSMDAADIAGASVLDRSGGARDGTLMGSPPPVLGPGRHGDALDFAATNIGFVDLPTLPVDTTPGGTNTIAMWFFHPDAAADEVLVYLPPGDGPAPPRYDLWRTTDGAGDPSLCINTGESECWGITDPGLVGRWVHVAATFVNGRASDGKLFVDGVAVAMECRFGTCDQTRVAEAPFTIGGSDSTYSWHGQIDDVRIYDRALSTTEVADLFACSP